MRVTAATASVAIALAGSPVATALAQDGPPRGVHADSPTGVEYQVPLDRARQDAGGGDPGQPGPAAGGSGSGGGSSDQTALFGAGITSPEGPGGSSGNGSAGDSKGGAPTGSGPDATGGGAARRIPGGEATGSRALPVQTASRIAEERDSFPTIAGLVFAVLALAGGMGLLLRRGLRRAGPS